MTRTWLIDKSALVRLGASPDAEDWADRIERGLVSVTPVTLLEAGFSARSALDLDRALGSAPLAAMSSAAPTRVMSHWLLGRGLETAAVVWEVVMRGPPPERP